MAAYCDCNKRIYVEYVNKNVPCTVWGYTVLSELYKVTWDGRQLQKWIIIIGVLLVDQYVVPVMQLYK